MSLIKSISGIRGTIGGRQRDGLSGVDIVKFTAAYASFIRKSYKGTSNIIVVGRDARISGGMVEKLVVGTLMSMGFDVVNIGLATTPTTELAVTGEGAAGGIIITASHNPVQWNALKLLNSNGEFLLDCEGKEVIRIAEAEEYEFSPVFELGHEFKNETWNHRHIEMVKGLELVDAEAIAKADFTVVVDAVNSVGGIVIPALLRELGVKNVVELNCEATGKFAHTPEPIPENLTQIADVMREGKADVGFVVDPDVDRLAIVMENGEMFIEENTLVSIADYVLGKTPGPTVSNLSSSRGLRDVTEKHGCKYEAAAVGEVNVVTKMKETGAVIGGEGNGGVIYPAIHYGRDALVGVALFLTMMAKSGKKVSEIKAGLPQYAIAKNKIQLTPDIDVDAILEAVKKKFSGEKITDIDGVKIDFPKSWVHLRKSNTEPIIRIYSEAATMEEADALAEEIEGLRPRPSRNDIWHLDGLAPSELVGIKFEHPELVDNIPCTGVDRDRTLKHRKLPVSTEVLRRPRLDQMMQHRFRKPHGTVEVEVRVREHSECRRTSHTHRPNQKYHLSLHCAYRISQPALTAPSASGRG